MIEIGGMKVYTLEEVTKITKLNKATVRKYIQMGKLRAKKIGRRWMVTEEAIKELYK